MAMIHTDDEQMLFQLNLAFEVDSQLETLDLKSHRRGQPFGSVDAPVGERRGHRLLDLTLRIDTDHFKKLADAQVERFLVHGSLLL
jgi:hypothetical protein